VRSAKSIDGDWGIAGTSSARIDDDPWDRLLGTYAKRGADGVNRFAYGAVTSSDRAALKAILALCRQSVRKITAAMNSLAIA
jgi:hypothetical protein